MSTVVVGRDLRDQLLAGVTAEVRDEDGKLLGRFVREEDANQFDHPPLGLTEDELDRRLAPDAKVYSTSEVLEHLRGLK